MIQLAFNEPLKGGIEFEPLYLISSVASKYFTSLDYNYEKRPRSYDNSEAFEDTVIFMTKHFEEFSFRGTLTRGTLTRKKKGLPC